MITSTRAKKEFKRRFGQANHFLITSLVGLDGIESGIVTKKPESFATSWSPQDPKVSARRARLFLLNSFLGWAVESLEMYVSEINRTPKEIQTDEFHSIYSEGHSIYNRTTKIGEGAGIDPVLIGLMEVLITWRNYVFHYDIDNKVRKESFELLLAESERISNEFSGLNVGELKTTWERGKDFSFKETASLIHATHQYVSELDRHLISKLDLERYAKESVLHHLKENPSSYAKYKSFQFEKQKNYLETLIQNKIGVDDVEEIHIDTIHEELSRARITSYPE